MSQHNSALEETMRILTDTSRLKVLGLLSVQAYSLDELATLLGVKTALAARHLRKLQRLNLIEIVPEKTASVSRYTLNMQPFRLLTASWHNTQQYLSQSEKLHIDEDVFAAWEREVIRRYFVGTQLTTIPAGRKNLEILVKWFAQLFEVGTTYQEKEVNAIIQRHYHDYAFFKKDLVGRGYLKRDYGVFKRVFPS